MRNSCLIWKKTLKHESKTNTNKKETENFQRTNNWLFFSHEKKTKSRTNNNKKSREFFSESFFSLFSRKYSCKITWMSISTPFFHSWIEIDSLLTDFWSHDRAELKHAPPLNRAHSYAKILSAQKPSFRLSQCSSRPSLACASFSNTF